MKLCLHKWGRWSAPYVDTFGTDRKLLQATVCEKCDKVMISRVKQPMLSRSHIVDLLRAIAAGRHSGDEESLDSSPQSPQTEAGMR